MCEKTKKFFYGFDLFGYVPSMRLRGQSDISSVCGGVTSMLVMGFFVYLFVVDMIDLANYGKIQASQTTQYTSGAVESLTGFMFAIGIDKINLRDYQEYFEFKASLETITNGQSQKDGVTLVECEPNMWLNTDGQEMTELFYEYGLEKMLCLDPNEGLELAGRRTADDAKILKIKITRCTNSSNPDVTCKSESEINSFMSSFLDQNKYFNAQFYYLNTAFNIKSEKPEAKFIENKIWLTFSISQSAEAYVELGHYEIQTDRSFWPNEDQEVKKGDYLVNSNTASFATGSQDTLIQILVSLSSERKLIQRSFGKIDDRLSYIGGLFEIVIIFLSFFINSYNLYRYELMVSEKTYTDTSGAKPHEKDFHFFTYIKYTFFQWFNMFCCCSLKWADCQKITEAREEANEQLDVEKMLRRMNHHEDFHDILSLEEEEKAIFLKNPKTLNQHRKRRKYLEYYDHIVKNEAPVTAKEVVVEKEKNLEITELASIESMDAPLPSHSNRDFLDFALKQTTNIMNIEQLQLQEEEEEIEEELAKAFSFIEKKHQSQIGRDIPLKILHRLKAKENKLKASQVSQVKVKRVQHFRQ